MTVLHPDDVQACRDLLPDSLLNEMKKLGNRVFVAGGCIRAVVARESVNDIDVFTEATIDADKLARKISIHCDPDDSFSTVEEDIHKTEYSWTIDTKPIQVQIIRAWNYATAQKVIDSFDFTISQAAIWWENGSWNSVCSNTFYSDLAARRIRYTGNPVLDGANPLNSALRVLKFYELGYVIDGFSYKQVVRMATPAIPSSVAASAPEGLITRKTKTY